MLTIVTDYNFCFLLGLRFSFFSMVFEHGYGVLGGGTVADATVFKKVSSGAFFLARSASVYSISRSFFSHTKENRKEKL